MKTFKKLAACALIAPLTMGAASVYAQDATPDRERAQEQREAHKPADERRGAAATQPQGMQQAGKAGHADKMGGKTQLTRAPENTFHVDWLMGKDINAQVGDDTVGTIRDLLVDEDGKIVAVIVGVGGMLGMGERDVAIPWDAIQHTRDADGDSLFTTSMTKSALENVPEYDRDASTSGDRDATGTRRDTMGTRDRDATTPRN